MLTRWMQGYRLLDEVTDTGDMGGGGPDLNIDIDAVSDEIGAGLGLGEKEPEGNPDAEGSATPPKDKGASPDSKPAPTDKAAEEARTRAEKAAKVAAARASLKDKVPDLDKKSDDEVLALSAPPAKTAPKAWKKEMHDHFSKLAPEVQDYVLEREAQVEQGFLSNKEAVDYGKALKDAIGPYQPLLDAQGVKDHASAVRYLLNAHHQLSTAPEETRLGLFARLMQSYKIDPAKLQAALQADPSRPQPTQAEIELRERMERLERERQAETNARYEAVKADVAKEVAAFAADPKNVYFKDVEGQIALLLQDPSITLEKAYEMAVYANPVTRAKELARISEETAAKAKKEAEEAAAAAEKARSTRIRSTRERASPDPLGSMDDTMRETLEKIKSRT